MKQLTWDKSLAITPFGNYRIRKNDKNAEFITEFPDNTYKLSKSTKVAKLKANIHWMRGLACVLDQPLVSLYSNPENWRMSVVNHDKCPSIYQLKSSFSLTEGVFLLYPADYKEVLELIQAEINQPIWQFNNTGHQNVFDLVVRMAI